MLPAYLQATSQLFTLQCHYNNLARDTEADFTPRRAHSISCYYCGAVCGPVPATQEAPAVARVLHRRIKPEERHLPAMRVSGKSQIGGY